MNPHTIPSCPAFAPLSLAQRAPAPSYVEPAPSYTDPPGVGVFAWLCATSIGTVIALCCLAASWVGSVTIGGAS